MVSTVEQLDDVAVDAARRDPHLLPTPPLLLGRALERNQRAVLQAELRSHAVGQVGGRRHAPFGQQRRKPLRIGDGVSRSGSALGRAAEDLHHFAAVIAVRRGAACHSARQVPGHDQVRIGAARSHLRALAEGIDATRPHVADVAAEPQLAEAAQRLQVLVTVPDGFGAQLGGADQHFQRGGVGGAVLWIRHIFNLQEVRQCATSPDEMAGRGRFCPRGPLVPNRGRRGGRR